MLLMGLDQGKYCVHPILLYIYMIYLLNQATLKLGITFGEISLTQLTFVEDICVFVQVYVVTCLV